MKHIGLYFGSFNPIHNTHISIAQQVLKEPDIDEVVLIVSPQNPFKDERGLLNEKIRYNMVYDAINGIEGLSVSDIEFYMPRPSYTYMTLKKLEEQNPDTKYSIIMGSDCLTDIKKWYEYEKILEHDIYIIPRFSSSFTNYSIIPHAHILSKDGFSDTSSTEIRKLIKEGRTFEHLVPSIVADRIKKDKLYE